MYKNRNKKNNCHYRDYEAITDNLSHNLKLSCPTLIGHLSRINKEAAEIFGSKLSFCPKMTLLALSLAAVLALNLSTAWAVTECPSGQTCYRGCGDDCLYYYTGEDSNKTLNIIGTGTMKNYAQTDYLPWFDQRNNITSVNISGVTSVGKYAFYDLSKLTSVNMPDVTTVGYYAFATTRSLTNIDMPKVTTIGAGAFEGTSSLTSIDLSNVTTIGNGAFRSTGLTSVYLPNVTTIGDHAFADTKSLTSVDMPEVKIIEYDAFYESTALASVNMPKVEAIGIEAFRSTALTNVDIPNVISIGEIAFYGTRLNYVGLNDDWQIDENGYFLDKDGNRVELPYNSNNCWEIGGKSDSNKCYATLGRNPFQGTRLSSCGQQGGSCTICTSSQVYQPGTGCTSACGTGYTASNGLCKPIKTAQNNQQSTGTGTDTASGTNSGTTTAASCPNGASIGGECLPRHYTPAEISQLVGESNTILLYYK